MNRNVFYSYVRKVPLGGKITPDQMKGLELILNHYEKEYPNLSLNSLAYILATAWGESKFIYNIEEIGGKKKPYAPFYGRGFAQLTHDFNYEKYGIKDNPKKALEPEMSVHILFDGMIKGIFTGKKLSNYFNKRGNNPLEARRIVNGTDKAFLFREYYFAFLRALEASTSGVETDKEVVATKTPMMKDSSLWTFLGGLASTAIAGITTPYGLGALVVIIAAGGLFFYLRNREKNAHGI